MGVVVAKFGGSSLADASQFLKVAEIVRADARRVFIVPSAPGKRHDGDYKVTDLLYALHDNKGARGETFALIKARYRDIVEQLGLPLDTDAMLAAVYGDIEAGASRDYAASRGEYLNGRVLAALLGYDFVDAADVVRFDERGVFDAEWTQRVMSAELKKHKNAVIPGFYGVMPDGGVKTFPRDGSDISGAIVARAAGADVYENWKDVSGFLMADPRIVENPRPIRSVTYRELRELSYMGASVLHEDAIYPVYIANIPIHILNTNAPGDPGTVIHSRHEGQSSGAITGIAGKKGFSAIAIEKNMMHSETGFGFRVLGALNSLGISFEHLPTGIDTMTVVIADANIEGKERALIEAIRAAVKPDSIELITGLSLIATVGRGMVHYTGSSAAIFSALAGAGVNVRMIDQGSSEMNVIVGVETEDFEKAVRAIYRKFVIK